MGPWQPTSAANVVLLDACASGGGYRFMLPGVRTMDNPSQASLDLALPSSDGGAIAAVGIRAWAKTRLAGSGTPLGARLDVVNSGSDPWLYTLESFGDGRSEFEPLAVTPLPRPASAVKLVLICEETDRPTPTRAAGTNCVANDAAPFELLGVEVTLREDVQPTGSAVGGSILAGPPVSGVRTLDYAASDGQSGVARIEAVVDGTAVSARDLGGRCAYVGFAACPLSDRDTMSIDTRNIADGRHVLSLRIIDAAGNAKALSVQSIDVQNSGASQSPIAILPGGPAKLTAGFGGSSRSTVIVPFSRRVTIRGRLRLTSSSGSGVAPAKIDVFERPARAGAKEVAVGQTRTRSDGTFSYTLAARRQSRSVRLAYASIASSRRLNVHVRAAATLKVLLRGLILSFSGRVLSAPLPANGKLVNIQGRSRGFSWSQVATLRADSRGRFSGRYRLRDYRRGVKLQFRVLVPAAFDYPYLDSRGQPIAVRVR